LVGSARSFEAMTMEEHGGTAGLNHTRQVTIDALCEHFANDAITMEDFESRIDVAHGATTTVEIRELLRDLPTGNLPAPVGATAQPVPGAQYQVASLEHVKETGYAIAVLGGSHRKGRWSPARVTHTISILGGVNLDFREAALPPGVTEVKVYTIMGGVEVIVPPGLNVESHGIGILGGFDHTGDNIQALDTSAPVLRISGVAIMGGVEIKTRHQGETARDARRRRRQERRDRRRRGLRGRMKEVKQDVKRLLD
jgi:hypothetical protein